MSISDLRKSVVRIYCVILVVIIAITMINIIYKSTPRTDFGVKYTYSISDDWTDEEGNVFNFDDIYNYKTDDEGYVTAYCTTPDRLTEGSSICFKTIDCYVRVSVDGENLYETANVQAPFYNKSPGIRWNLIKISGNNHRKNIVLKIKPAYDRDCQIDHIIMGDRARIIIEIISEKQLDIIASIIALLLGIICAFFAAIINSRREKGVESDYGLAYFATFVIAGSIWSLSETDVLQLFVADVGLVNQVAEISFILGIIPLIMYLDSTYGIMKFLIVRILTMINCVYLFLATGLHIWGVMDFHNAVYWALVLYEFAFVLIVMCISHSFIEMKKDPDLVQIHVVLRNVGLSIMAGTMAIDTYRYFNGEVDRALASRYGVLILTLLVGTGNIYHSLVLIQTGLKSEFISKLAYSDGLTEVGNRTAFNERVDAIIKENNGKVGFAVFDVNNLKTVNDTLGHAKGDEIICICADIIEDTFGKHGKVYRIGGDEFAVIIYDEDAQAIYDKDLKHFYRKIMDYNKGGEVEFKVVIAHGFAVAQTSEEDIVRETLFKADKLMYEDKAALKKLYPNEGQKDGNTIITESNQQVLNANKKRKK